MRRSLLGLQRLAPNNNRLTENAPWTAEHGFDRETEYRNGAGQGLAELLDADQVRDAASRIEASIVCGDSALGLELDPSDVLQRLAALIARLEHESGR